MILFFASLFMYNTWATEHARKGTNPREVMLKALAYSAALAVPATLSNVRSIPMIQVRSTFPNTEI